MTRIKVSGVTRPEDAALCGELGVDVVGCVFYAKSPRYVTAETAWSIRHALPAGTVMAGIFVDAPLPLVRRLAMQCELDLIQLFGNEPPDEVAALGSAACKAVTVRNRSDAAAAGKTYLDGKAQRKWPALELYLDGELAEDWALAAEIGKDGPLILASRALSAANAATAVQAADPWAVDVWEAVESEPGRLDPARLRALVAAARSEPTASTGADDDDPPPNRRGGNSKDDAKEEPR